jgi:hypothetical protein
MIRWTTSLLTHLFLDAGISQKITTSNPNNNLEGTEQHMQTKIQEKY